MKAQKQPILIVPPGVGTVSSSVNVRHSAVTVSDEVYQKIVKLLDLDVVFMEHDEE